MRGLAVRMRSEIYLKSRTRRYKKFSHHLCAYCVDLRKLKAYDSLSLTSEITWSHTSIKGPYVRLNTRQYGRRNKMSRVVAAIVSLGNYANPMT